jgi:hypothetical protein
MDKPAMRDWKLRLLRLLYEKKVLTSTPICDQLDIGDFS